MCTHISRVKRFITQATGWGIDIKYPGSIINHSFNETISQMLKKTNVSMLTWKSTPSFIGSLPFEKATNLGP